MRLRALARRTTRTKFRADYYGCWSHQGSSEAVLALLYLIMHFGYNERPVGW